MKKPQLNPAHDPTALRRSAEQQLTTKPDNVAAALSDDKPLIDELQVHQIELEMLYENLSHAQIELENPALAYTVSVDTKANADHCI